MQTIKEKKGYVYECGIYGKRWTRGKIRYSTGKKYTGNGPESIPCIVKTNLDTGEMEIASLAEHKKFLTPESYQEFLLNEFKKLAENA